MAQEYEEAFTAILRGIDRLLDAAANPSLQTIISNEEQMPQTISQGEFIDHHFHSSENETSIHDQWPEF